jgi:anti-sigma-K factor RskA
LNPKSGKGIAVAGVAIGFEGSNTGKVTGTVVATGVAIARP